MVDLGDLAVGPAARALLAAALADGLGEFAYRNGLDLADVVVRGGTPLARAAAAAGGDAGPLIPFGGGIDSIVTATRLPGARTGRRCSSSARATTRFEAIERPARQTGLPDRPVRSRRSTPPCATRRRAAGSTATCR